MIRSFAPGEIILFGEHSVVYGRRALAVSLRRGITTTFQSRDNTITIKSQLGSLMGIIVKKGRVKYFHCDRSLRPFRNMIQRCFKFAELQRGFYARIDSELPAASGLASSAAVSASFIAGLLYFLGKKINKKKLFSLVYKSELDIQKRGSIIGSASAVYGGLIEVNKAKLVRCPFPSSLGTIIIADSQQKCPTAVSTAIVKRHLVREPSWTNQVFDTMHCIATEGKQALLKRDKETLGKLFNQNQQCLVSLGVSTEKIDRYLKKISPFVHGSKITGAGGGGCVFSLVKTGCVEKIFRIAQRCHMQPFRVVLGNCGVSINGKSL